MQKKRRLWGWAFVAPQLIGLMIFAVIPLLMSFVISFHTWDGIAPQMEFVGLSNYIHQLGDSDFTKSLTNTVVYSLMFIPIDMILALAAFGIFVFLGQWNNFLYPLIFLNKTESFTVPLLLNFFKGTYATDYPLLMAGTVISILPVLVVYMFFQKQIIQGIAVTGMKN